MDTNDQPSERVVLQRIRNRAMEAVEILADGDEGVRAVGPSEYFNVFFDWIDDRSPWAWRSWACFTPAEVQALDAVLKVVEVASESTPTIMSTDELILSGWPTRISPIASDTLAIMRSRGVFREDAEEDEPSSPG